MKKILIIVLVPLVVLFGFCWVEVEQDQTAFCKATVELVASQKAAGRKSYDVQRDLTAYIQSNFPDANYTDRYTRIGQDVVRRTYRNNNPMEACK